jgi:uncharacterized membrane protein
MEAKIKLFGHPVHQMLIVFPLGLLGMSVIFDLVGLIGESPKWAEIASWMLRAGIISGLIAAPFGTMDWLSIPKRTRAKQVGLVHGIGNVIVVGLFAAGWFLRQDAPESPSALSLTASYAGFLLALVTGWLGGELVNRLGVGVHDHVGLNAPSSLRRDASTTRPLRREDRAA